MCSIKASDTECADFGWICIGDLGGIYWHVLSGVCMANVNRANGGWYYWIDDERPLSGDKD